MGALSMVLGILSVLIWPLPLGGLVVSAASLGLGITTRRFRKSSLALAGIILGALGLTLALFEFKFRIMNLILKTYFQY